LKSKGPAEEVEVEGVEVEVDERTTTTVAAPPRRFGVVIVFAVAGREEGRGMMMLQREAGLFF
jgi:hypothetical protein